jgi:hypothetical protein
MTRGEGAVTWATMTASSGAIRWMRNVEVDTGSPLSWESL